MKTAAVLQFEAWKVLVRGLGMADALRYRILFESGGGDYSSEREVLFGHMTLDDWVEDIRCPKVKHKHVRRRGRIKKLGE